MWCTLTTDYPPNPGGVARYAHRTAERYGTSVFIPRVPRILGGWLMVVFSLLRRKDTGYFVHQVLPMGTVCWLANVIRSRPYVVFFHGMDAALAQRNAWKRWLTRRILRRAHTVVANTYALARELRDAFGVEPIVVHPMASILAADDFMRPRKSDTVIHLLSVARFVERKGMQRVLAVLAKHPQWASRMRYRMMGTGEYSAVLRALIAQYGLGAWVSVEETRDDALLHEAYAWADVFVLPTISMPKDREGFGIVYLEAGSFGLPCIASRIPGVDEAVIDGETGALVSSDEELEQVLEQALEDASWRERCGAVARARVRAMREDMVYAPLDMALGNSTPARAKVSAIIPLYNHQSTLARTVQAVLAQEGVEVEVIVVNDGSTDGGGALADALSKEDARIRVVHQANAGAPAARNAGLRLATGDFVVCLDADALLRPGVLASWVRVLAMHPRASYVYGDFLFGGRRFHTGAFSLARLRARNFIHTGALVRAEAGLHFDETLKRFQDWDAWLTLAARGKEGVWDGGEIAMDIAVERPGYSFWLPRIAYRAPFSWLPRVHARVVAYRNARAIIATKHSL